MGTMLLTVVFTEVYNNQELITFEGTVYAEQLCHCLISHYPSGLFGTIFVKPESHDNP